MERYSPQHFATPTHLTMSTTRSLFSNRSSKAYSRISASSHELPYWKPSSTIPPPIVQSTYVINPRTLSQPPPIIIAPTPLLDKQKELESDLQFLLDAQADGLSGGFNSGGLPDDRTSEGSTTPTIRSARSASSRRAARPPRRKPGIRSARKGIYNSILALSNVKAEEIDEIDEDVRGKDDNLDKISEWQQKREKLQAASKHVDASEDVTRSQRLRHEADKLQVEINNVELQLADMKGRQKKLMKEANAAENAVQAKLASYTSSLQLLEADVQRFLSLDPTESSNGRPPSRDQTESVWQLPPKRRTLELALQYWSEEKDAVLQQRENTMQEKVALDEGATFWKDIVVQITDFERALRTDMAEQSAAGQTASPDMLDRLNDLIRDLDAKFDIAAERRWNPLIAAIGAELDALKQARQLLGGGNAPSSPELQRDDDSDHGNTSSDSNESPSEPPPAMDRRKHNGSPPEDDPDPELLFSKQLDSE